MTSERGLHIESTQQATSKLCFQIFLASASTKKTLATPLQIPPMTKSLRKYRRIYHRGLRHALWFNPTHGRILVEQTGPVEFLPHAPTTSCSFDIVGIRAWQWGSSPRTVDEELTCGGSRFLARPHSAFRRGVGDGCIVAIFLELRLYGSK